MGDVTFTTNRTARVVEIIGLKFSGACFGSAVVTMSQATPTSDARHAVAAEQEQAPAALPCPIGHDRLADPCKRLWCGCGCAACRKMCGETNATP